MGVSGSGSLKHGDSSGNIFWLPSKTFLKSYYCLLLPSPPVFPRRHCALSSAFRGAARDVPLLLFALNANTQCNARVP